MAKTITNPKNDVIALELAKANPTSKYASLLEYDAENGTINAGKLSLFADEPQIANEFISDMMNKIIVQRAYDLMRGYETPFKRFMRPMSRLGDAEELLTAELAQVNNYKATGTNPFEAGKPSIKLAWIKTTDKKEVEVCLSYEIWAGAFTSEEGLSNIAGIIIKNLGDSLDLYLYDVINGDFVDKEKITKSYTITSVTGVGQVEASQKAYEEIIKLANEMTLPRNTYNTSELRTITPKGRLVLVLNAQYRSAFDVNVLASLFHSDKVGENKYFAEVILADLDATTVGVILDEEAFMYGFRINQAGSIYNPKTLEINTFMHRWIKRALVPWRNAVRLVVE